MTANKDIVQSHGRASTNGRLTAYGRLLKTALPLRRLAIAAIAAAFVAGQPADAATRTLENGRWYNRSNTGSIWWGQANQEGSINADGQLVFGGAIGYTGSTVKRKFEFWLNYGLVGDTVTNSILIVRSKPVAPSKASGTAYVFHGGWVSESDVEYIDKGPFDIPGFDFSQDVWFSVTFSNTLYNGSAPSAADDLTTYSEDYVLRQAYFGDFGATWSNDAMEFYVTGWAAAGYNFEKARLTYSIDGSDLDSSSPTMTQDLDADDAFLFTIPHSTVYDVLTWKVDILRTDGTAITYIDKTSGKSVFTTAHQDPDPADNGIYVTYTWTGAGGDGCWTNHANWSSDYALCRGYPGTLGGRRVYASTARFGAAATGAVVDLGGGSYAGGAGNSATGALVVDPGIGELTLRNGTYGLGNNSAANYIGASGTTLVLDDVDLVYLPGNAGTVQIGFAANSTTVFEGDSAQTKWVYAPNASKANTKMVVRNGTLAFSQQPASSASVGQHTVLISNAVWRVNGSVPGGVAASVVLRDGADRQAQLVATGEIGLSGFYDIAVPKGGHRLPSIQAASHSSATSSAASFSVDVSDYGKSARVPLVAFSGTDQTSKMETKLANTTLAAASDGKDVAALRNARLEWASADNTLYYGQDNVESTVFVLR